MRELLFLFFVELCLLVSLGEVAKGTTADFNSELLEEWDAWKSQHGKSYTHRVEEMERHLIWASNRKYIEEHNANADVFGYTLAMNHFGDLSEREWLEQYTTDFHNINFTKAAGQNVFVPPKPSPLNASGYPDYVDWRTKNAVTPVKNQGLCGACYAFSAVGAIEGAQSLTREKLVPLSEQNIIDCSVPYGNHGCNGGDVAGAFQYVISNGGIDTAAAYPFTGKQGQCSYNKAKSSGSMSGVVNIKSGSEEDLLAAVATVGPIAVNVDGSSNGFRFYAGGVFDTVHCSSTSLTHSMLVTGYGTYKGKKYWLVKNSWGKTWGQKGYIMMVRDHYNQCGIATAASYPTL